MNKFIIKLSLFTLLILIFSLFIVNVDISDEYIIHKTQGTGYDKIAFNLKLLHDNPERINNAIVFFGPSLVQGGVSDEVLSENGIKSVNMAVNEVGKEIELYFFLRILKLKPKKVYFFANYEIVSLHKMTPLLYDPILLISTGQSINCSFINYYLKRVSFVADYIKWSIAGQKIENVKNRDSEWGVVFQTKAAYTEDEFNSLQDRHNSSLKRSLGYSLGYSLKDSLIKKLKRCIVKFLRISFIKDNILTNLGSQHKFLLNIINIANDTDIQIAGIYIPVMADTFIEKESKDTLFFADTLIKIETLDDFKFLSKGIYWSDPNHLSKEGCIYFTKRLGGLIRFE